MILEVGVFLGAVVVCQLQQAFQLTLIGGGRFGVAEEEEREFCGWVVGGTQKCHAHGFLVEFEGGVSVFDSYHCVILDKKVTL